MVYLPLNSQNPKLTIDSDTKFSIKWFDPRNGGEVQKGIKKTIVGGETTHIGSPPSDLEQD